MSYCSTGSGNFTNTRQTQINNYAYERYLFLSTAMTRFSYVLIYLIIILILRNAEVMPEGLFGWLFVPVLAYLALDMLYTFYSFSKRGAVNFDTYIWTFNKKAAIDNSAATGGGGGGGGGTGQITATVQCTNSACCQSGMAWNANIGKCTFPV